MAIPVAKMQGVGAFHVPGLREPVTGYHVRRALPQLEPCARSAVQQYLDRGGKGKPPPDEVLRALREAVVVTVLNGRRAAPEGEARRSS
jgi:hypothetical protein